MYNRLGRQNLDRVIDKTILREYYHRLILRKRESIDVQITITFTRHQRGKERALLVVNHRKEDTS